MIMNDTGIQQTAGWSKHNGQWLVCCAGSETGRQVTVRRQDGSNPARVVLGDAVAENQWGKIYRYTRCDEGQGTRARSVARQHQKQPERPRANHWVMVRGSWMVEIRDGKKYEHGDMITVSRLDGETHTRMVLDVDGGMANVVGLLADGTYECKECGEYVLPGSSCWETGHIH